jgi:hypothetical protein
MFAPLWLGEVSIVGLFVVSMPKVSHLFFPKESREGRKKVSKKPNGGKQEEG